MKKMIMFFLLLLCSMGFAQEIKEAVNGGVSKTSMPEVLKAGAAQSSFLETTPAGGEVTYLVDYEGTGETKTGYASGEVVLSGLNWNMTEALIGTLADDFKNGARSARLRGYGASAMTMLEDKADGLGEITFLYRRYGTDAQVDWRVEYSDDQGATWNQVGSDFTSPANDDVQMFSEEVNVEGAVRVRIIRATQSGTANRRLNIDDIQLTDYVGGGGGECEPGNITTFFNQNNGLAGNMFDVSAIGGEDVEIEKMDINLGAGTANISVFYRPGSYVGFENNSSGWTLLGTETVTGAGINNPTEVNIGGLIIPAGETYGLYVTVSDYPSVTMYYTNGDNTFSDTYVQIQTGVGKGNPDFTGSTFASRSWNGTLYYCAGEGGGGGGCTTPVITNTTGDDICSGDTATLTAETNGEELLWFDAEVNGNLLGTGTTFVTDPLIQTTSFWAEARNYGSGGGTPQTGGARVAPTNTSSSAVVQATSPWGLEFTVEEDFTLNSVDVYLASANPGDLVVQLKDLSLNVLEEITIACPAGNSSNPVQFEIPLNWSVQAGNTYRLVAESSPVMVREFSSGHPGFPYPIGDVGTVTNGTINNAYTNVDVYYFFYNWAFTPGSGEYCASDRVEVIASVTVTPPPVAASPQEYTEGQTLADLDVDGENLTWYADPDGNTELPESTPLVDGTTYYVSQTVDGCESELIAIQVILVLSIDEHTISGLQYYPNPVTNVLNITAKVTIDDVEVYNLLGQKIINQNLNSTSGQIDLSELASGSYLMKVNSGELSTAFQVLKR